MHVNANILAWAALILCFPVSLIIVSLWRPAVSVPLILLAGQMFLPPVIGFEIPSLAPLDKSIVAPLSALIACSILRPKSLVGARPGTGLDLFIVVRILIHLVSCLTNRDPVPYAQGSLPALSGYTFLTGSVNLILYWWPTIFLGRTLIKTSRDLRTLLVIMAGAALCYALFILFELRMSPQLNIWIYGFHQHDFMQSVRAGGYRPVVFMRHGLNVAFFLAISIMASAVLATIKARVFGVSARVVTISLFALLMFCHSLGALIYAVLAVPLIWFTKPKTQVRIASVVALLVFCYPLARALDLVPVDDINRFAVDWFGEERAESLTFRLSNEAGIMTRATQRPLFGWGGGRRYLLIDPINGETLTVPDGMWVIQFGVGGAAGFVCIFGMLLYPVKRSRRALSRLVDGQDRAMVAGLALMGAIYLIEMIPNSSMDPYITFVIAALAGICRRGLQPDPSAPPAEPQWVQQETTSDTRPAF